MPRSIVTGARAGRSGVGGGGGGMNITVLCFFGFLQAHVCEKKEEEKEQNSGVGTKVSGLNFLEAKVCVCVCLGYVRLV